MSHEKDEETSAITPLMVTQTKTSYPSAPTKAFFKYLFDSGNINTRISAKTFATEGGTAKISKLLKADLENGLDINDSSDINWREREWGGNGEISQEVFGFWHFVWDALHDQMLQILLLAAIISVIVGILQEGFATGWIEGSTIFLAVFLVVSISSYINYSKDQQFHALNEENNKKNVAVKRNGKESFVDVYSLLVGDILQLNIGDIVPVDGILTKGQLMLDESSMTGESDLVKKTPNIIEAGKKTSTPFIISGTKVQDGCGEMVVCAVGENSIMGNAMKLATNDEDVRTPLQDKLGELADQIGSIGFIVAGLIGLVLILKDVLLKIIRGESIFVKSTLDAVLNAFIISVVVIVVAIPEGLPMAVTISLAYSVRKMNDEHNLVKNLNAAETMGNVNNICTDKTGTLTYGEMKLNSIYIDEKVYTLGNFDKLDDTSSKTIRASIINNVSTKLKTENGVEIAEGNPTEVGLMSYVLGTRGYKELKHQKPIVVLPLNSEYKFMASIYDIPSEKKYKMYIKGGPDVLLKKSSTLYSSQKSLELTEERKKNIERVQEDFAEGQQRTLIIGHMDINPSVFQNLAEKHNNELTKNFFDELIGNKLEVIAVVGIIDPHRRDVPEAIRKCKTARVLVRMVTGDFIKTAIAIAKEIKILSEVEARDSMTRVKQNEERQKAGVNNPFEAEDYNKNIYAMEGPEFRAACGGYVEKEEGEGKDKTTKRFLKNPDIFRKVTKNLKVIARASPDDKFLLVLGLKELGNIVAVTGDGTNDAPALNVADVGFAMGIRGTDIAKATSDIILQDDSFSSIITAIKYGRNVYDCIRKFLQFQLTTNCVAVFMTLLGGVILNDAPLNAIQMLWVNLIMDSFASLALATESPKDILLTRRPYPKTDYIITPYMAINVVTQSLLQIIILTIVIFYGDWFFGVPSDRELTHYEWNDVNGYHFTIFFNIFVFLQVFNSINARKLGKAEKNVFSGIFDNSLYIIVQLIIIFGQILMVQIGGRALRTKPLSIYQHFLCIAISSISIVLSLIVKLTPFGDEEPEEEEGRTWLKSIKSVKSRKNTNKTIPISIKKK